MLAAVDTGPSGEIQSGFGLCCSLPGCTGLLGHIADNGLCVFTLCPLRIWAV